MALIPRIKLQADIEDPAIAAVVDEIGATTERLGAGSGFDMVSSEVTEIDGLYDLVLGILERAVLTKPVVIQRHDCPHVLGFEEPSWTNCTDPQYNFTSVVV